MKFIDKHLLYNPAPIHLKTESKDASNKLTSQFLYLGGTSMLKKLRKRKEHREFREDVTGFYNLKTYLNSTSMPPTF